jgi:hypothetical protein
MKWTLILFGNWPGFGPLYDVWTALVGMVYAGCIVLELHWWLNDSPSFALSQDFTARIAELSFFVQMNAAFWMTWYTLRWDYKKRDRVIQSLLADESLLACDGGWRYIEFAFVIAILYLVCTVVTYVQILCAIDVVTEPVRYVFVVLTGGINLQYVASVKLYVITCIHKRQQAVLFAEAAEQWSIEELKQSFKQVGEKLEILGDYFNWYLSACNVASLCKYAALVVSGAERIDSQAVQSKAFLFEILLMSRVLIITVYMDMIGTLVHKAAGRMNQKLMAWRPQPQQLQHTHEIIMMNHEQQILLSSFEVLQIRGFECLKVFGMSLTSSNLVKFAYVVGGLTLKTIWSQDGHAH